MKNLVVLIIFGLFSFALTQTCQPPCEHGGRCQPANACYCGTTGGWSGDRCEVAICSGGCGTGNCTAPDNCDCSTPGWTGTNCEIPVCEPECENGGTCTGVNACTCAQGWTAALCQTAICTPSCQNGGVCTFPPDQCDCTGAPGWNGTYCDRAICTVVHCEHGGYCSGPDICDCSGTGYGGWECDLEINECESLDPLACDPLTDCTNTTGSYNCTACPALYTGTGKTGCTWDACGAGGCSPVATCQENTQAQTYTCGACPDGYTGDGHTCTDDDECDHSNACDPLTTCINTPGSYNCTDCPDGYTGNGKSGCVDESGDGGSPSTASQTLFSFAAFGGAAFFFQLFFNKF